MTARLSHLLTFGIIAGSLLSGCIMPDSSSAPTPYPAGYIPTVIYLTAEAIQASTQAVASPTQVPTELATEGPTLIPPTLAPSVTPTAGPGIPLAAIQIRAPGPMSRVVSPLQVNVLVVAGDSKKVEVDLFGEDGSLLGRTLRAVVGSPEGDPLSAKIPFEIRGNETGFVQVSTKDITGRVQSLATLQVLLLTSGYSQINPPGNTIYERVVLPQLAAAADISGGIVELTGEVLPYNRQPIIVELISNDGKNLGLRVLTTTGTDWQSFDTTVPYKVDKPTPARLYIHQADDLLSTQAYIYSQPILLKP